MKDGSYHLVKIEDTIHDITGLTSTDPPVMGDDEFYQFSDMNGCLAHRDIRSNLKLTSLLSFFASECYLYREEDLGVLCEEKDFQQWLSVKENDIRFLGFLLKRKFISKLWKEAIFLGEDGTLRKAGDMYYDVDKYMDDLSFLNDWLPRLNSEIRDALSAQHENWDGYIRQFKSFDENEFTSSVLAEFNKGMKDLLRNKSNSVHFIHYLAVTDCNCNIPSEFPLVNDKDIVMTNRRDIFLVSTAAKELATHPWISQEWLNFISEDYFAKDAERVKSFMTQRLSLRKLEYKDCFTDFIARGDRSEYIAKQIMHKDANVDFYRYLAKIRDSLPNVLQPQVRKAYTIIASDGKKDYYVSLEKTIYWQGDDWKELAGKCWMPDCTCLALSRIYLDGLMGDVRDGMEQMLSNKKIVQDFSLKTFLPILKKNFDKAAALISTKEASKDFLNFLFCNKKYLAPPYDSFTTVPILYKGHEQLKRRSSAEENVYMPNSELNELLEQPWFDRRAITACDDFYADLFDGGDRRDFFQEFGFVEFKKVDFITDFFLPNLDVARERLEVRENNLAFHHYIADMHMHLSEAELEKVKEMPIYISSPDSEKGVLSERSNNHYLPSPLLTGIVARDIMPLTIMNSLHPDYIRPQKDVDIAYFRDKLRNQELNEKEFIHHITYEGNTEVVQKYLQNPSRNVRFWRWACDSKLSGEAKSPLNVFMMLARTSDDEVDSYASPKDIFATERYTKQTGMDSFIAKYIEKPKFVSPAYMEDDEKRDWMPLFKALKVKVDFSDIIFGNILPELGRYKDKSIVPLLAQYYDRIEQELKLSATNAAARTIKEQLGNIQLLCQDGEYRKPEDAIVTGRYYDIDLTRFVDISIGHVVSEQYIDDCGDDDAKRRSVKKFIAQVIGDNLSRKCETATSLRDYKLKYFASHQKEFLGRETHLRIMVDLALEYNNDNVGIGNLLTGMPKIKVLTIKGTFLLCDSLYLSTVYHPECEFMANGVENLEYVSEAYADYCESDYFKRLFTRLGVRETFSEENLPQLSNPRFATYFWEIYSNKEKGSTLRNICTEETLRAVNCIPSKNGVKRPGDLYDYRISDLQKMVKKLKDGESKLPSVTLPDWLGRIGLRSRLYLLDILEYLSLDTLDYRREVMKWLTDTPENYINKYKREISNYAESANWMNGSKEWAPLKNLVALEWDNPTLRDNFRSNPNVCNPSYMPEYKDDFNKLCRILGIKVLTNEDFKKRKEGEWKRDDEAVREISKRLMYLAFKADEKKWKELYDNYLGVIQRADISTCEKITYFYNDDIKTPMHLYSETADALWYKGQWNGPMFLGVIEWIKKKVGIKGEFDENYLLKIFLTPYKTILNEEESGKLPKEFLEATSNDDKEGLVEDDSADAEEFKDEMDSTISPPMINIEATGAASTPQPVNKYDDPASGEATSSNSTDDDRESPNKPDTGKRAYNGSHKDGSDKTEVTKREERGSQAEPQEPNEKEKTLTERLNEKWEGKKKSPIRKPLPQSGSRHTLEPIDGVGGESSGEGAPFFGEVSAPSSDNTQSRASRSISRKNTEAQRAAKDADDK